MESVASKANVPEVKCGGVTVRFSEFSQVREQDGGVALRANASHQARGVELFFPREICGPIKDALGIHYAEEFPLRFLADQGPGGEPDADESHPDHASE